MDAHFERLLAWQQANEILRPVGDKIAAEGFPTPAWIGAGSTVMELAARGSGTAQPQIYGIPIVVNDSLPPGRVELRTRHGRWVFDVV